MKYFLDTEFIDRGHSIDLISIGIVREDGKEFYRVNRDCDFPKASSWVRENVLKPMGIRIHADFQTIYSENYNNLEEWVKHYIAEHLEDFFSSDDDIEIWGWYCSYDWVVFCQLFGPMVNLPKGFPMRIRDLKQEMDKLPKDLRPTIKGTHNALEDAKVIREGYLEVQKLLSLEDNRKKGRQILSMIHSIKNSNIEAKFEYKSSEHLAFLTGRELCLEVMRNEL